jgi:hypothetical protein
MSVHSYFQETCLRLGDGSCLYLTLDRRAEHDDPVRETRLTYAYRVLADSSHVDALALLSLALMPDLDAARRAEQTAQGQREVAALKSHPHDRRRYLDNAEAADWEAGQYRRFAREMPNIVVEVAPGVVCAAYRNGRPASRFRVIDFARGEVVVEFGGPDVDKLYGGPKRFERSAQEQAMLDALREEFSEYAAHLPPSSGTLPSRVRLIAGGANRLLMHRGQGGVVLITVDGDQIGAGTAFGATSPVGGRIGVFCRGRCIVHYSELGRSDGSLLVIDAVSGRVEHKLPQGETSFDEVSASESAGLVAWSQSDGSALVLDVETGATRTCKILHGLDQGHACISLSPDGKRLVAFEVIERQATLTELATGRYAFIELPDTERERSNVGRGVAREPALVALDDGVETIAAGRRTRIDAAVLSFREPRRRSSTLTAVDATDLGALIDALGLSAHSSRLVAWRRLTLALLPERLPRDDLPLGASKFGGRPDLMHGAPWPLHEGRQMSFLAQFNLAELAGAGLSGGWPTRGLLSFFRYEDEDRLGEVHAKVLYAPDVEELERIAPSRFGEGVEETSPCRLRLLRRLVDLPALDSARLQRSGFSPDEREAYLEILRCFVAPAEDAERWHYLGGYPTTIQSNICEIIADRLLRGVDQYRWPSDPAELDAELDAATGWVQLVQFDSCGVAEWMWGDNGIEHWMIPEADLAAGRFDRVRIAFECH